MTTNQLIAEFERVLTTPPPHPHHEVCETLGAAIRAGNTACAAFSAAVVAAGYKSRWDRIDYEKHTALKAARDAHHAAGRVLHEAFVRSRETA